MYWIRLAHGFGIFKKTALRLSILFFLQKPLVLSVYEGKRVVVTQGSVTVTASFVLYRNTPLEPSEFEEGIRGIILIYCISNFTPE